MASVMLLQYSGFLFLIAFSWMQISLGIDVLLPVHALMSQSARSSVPDILLSSHDLKQSLLLLASTPVAVMQDLLHSMIVSALGFAVAAFWSVSVIAVFPHPDKNIIAVSRAIIPRCLLVMCFFF